MVTRCIRFQKTYVQEIRAVPMFSMFPKVFNWIFILRATFKMSKYNFFVTYLKKKGRIHVTTALIFSPLNNFKVITSKLLTLLPRQKCYFRSFIRVSNLFWTRYSSCKAIVFKIKRGGMHFNLKCYRFSQCPWIALNSTPGVSVSTTHIVLPHLQSVWLVTIVGRRLGFWLKCSVQ